MTDLDAIRSLANEFGYALAERTTPPVSRLNQYQAAMDALLAIIDEQQAEIERLQSRKVRFINPGEITEYQRDRAHDSKLYAHGDMLLVWVNEGDFWLAGASEHD